MYNHKKKSIKIYSNLSILFLLGVVSSIIFAIYGIYQVNASKNFQFSKKLQEKQREKNFEKELTSKGINNDLFNIAFDITSLTTTTLLKESLKQTKQLINDLYLCNMTEDNISNILYRNNINFKYDMQGSVLKDKLPKDKKVYNSMMLGCNKFLLCKNSKIKNEKNFNINIDNINDCINTINKTYKEISKQQEKNILTQKQANGDELFWNGNLNDSSYDIIYDIYEVGKLLFESFEQPQNLEIFNYSLLSPEPGKENEEGNQRKRNRFDKNRENNTTNNLTNNSNSGTENAEQRENEQGASGDNDHTSNISINQDSSNKLGNQCESIEKSQRNAQPYNSNDFLSFSREQQYQIIKNIEKKAEKITNKIKESTCNTNGIYEIGEDKNCKDYNAKNNNNAINTNVQENEDLIILASTCIKKCQQKYPPTSSDKILCIMKCSCTTYESDFWKDVEGLSNIFRMRICMIPPTGGASPKIKKIYSIEEIIFYTQNTLKKLVESGRLNVLNKTSEAADSSNKNLNISKMASISIDVKNAKPKAQEDKKKKSDKNKNENQNTKNNKKNNNKNKYAIMFNPNAEAVKDIGYNNKDEQQNIENGKKKEKTKSKYTANKNLNSFQNTIKPILETFLEDNIYFWNNTKEAFKEFYNTVDILQKK